MCPARLPGDSGTVGRCSRGTCPPSISEGYDLGRLSPPESRSDAAIALGNDRQTRSDQRNTSRFDLPQMWFSKPVLATSYICSEQVPLRRSCRGFTTQDEKEENRGMLQHRDRPLCWLLGTSVQK